MKIKNLFDPRKSPLLYFIAFFLAVPAVVYGIVGTSAFEAGRAATIGSYVEITAPTEGQTFARGTSVKISVQGNTELPGTLNITVNNVPANCSDVTWQSVSGAFSATCYWDATFTGTMRARAVLVQGSSDVTATIEDSVTFSVVDDEISYTWSNPTNNATVNGSLTFQWIAGGFLSQSELAATRYSIYLDASQITDGSGVTAGTLLASGSLGTSGVCSWVDYGGLWSCRHSSAWDSSTISSGKHTLTGVLNMIDIYQGKTASETITINVNNTDNLPVCQSLTLSDNDIYSGESVTITAVGDDPDNTAITRGQVNYGNGQTSGYLTASSDSVSVTYSGYSVASGSAQYSVTARFESNSVWGPYACAQTITVRARESGNTCPVITSSPIRSVKVGSTYSYTLRYTDDSDDVILKALLKPGWLSWNASTGVLSGTPTSANIGTYSVVLAVDDGDPTCHTQQSFTIRVWDDDDDDSDDGDDGDVGGAGEQAPSVVVTNPSAGSKFSCGTSTIAWYVTDDGTIEKIWMEYSSDGETWTKIDGDLAGTATSYDWDVCALPLGTYYVRVWARDDDGNTRAGLSGQFEIISAGEVSESPRIIDPQPEPNSKIAEVQPTISATFVAGASAIDEDTAQIKLDDKDITAYATVTTGGFSYVPTEELGLGEHTVYVKVADVDGKTVERNWAFEVTSSATCSFDLLGLSLPCWIMYALIVCGALLLLLIIVVAISRLVSLAREGRDEEERQRGGEEFGGETGEYSEGDSGGVSDWTPPEPGPTVPPDRPMAGAETTDWQNVPPMNEGDKPTVRV